MSVRNFKKMVVLVIALVCISAGLARADKLQLQEKLSKIVKIQLNDVTIAGALEKIGQKAGVKFVLSDEAAWKLPQGEATRLSVALDGPLAESMTEMLNAFFMRYAVGDEEITIYPRPELEHILGRPTEKQLKVLTSIYTRPINEYSLNPQNTIGMALGGYTPIVPFDVLDEIGYVLHKLASKGQVDPRPEDLKFELLRPVTVANVLEQALLRMYGGEAKWYLSGMDFPYQAPEVRVIDAEDFRQAKLDQLVDISFKNEKAEVILKRLASWTGMELFVSKRDPSWLEEKISVNMQNTKLRQAIRNIVSTVNGKVEIDIGDDRIYVDGPMSVQKTTARKSKKRAVEGSEGYVGKISIPMDGGKYYIEFMLRENDLTEELKKLREEKMKEVLGEKDVEQKIEKKSD